MDLMTTRLELLLLPSIFRLALLNRPAASRDIRLPAA
jgi:hypothetical protein